MNEASGVHFGSPDHPMWDAEAFSCIYNSLVMN